MAKKVTEKQREILARRLGYQGPMEMFDQFVRSDPAMERKYSVVMQKLMARGGVVKKYQEGGAVPGTYTRKIEDFTTEEIEGFNKLVIEGQYGKAASVAKSANVAPETVAEHINKNLQLFKLSSPVTASQIQSLYSDPTGTLAAAAPAAPAATDTSAYIPPWQAAPSTPDQIRAAWDARNITEVNRLLAANPLSYQEIKSTFNIDDVDMQALKAQGVNVPTSPTTPETPPTTTTTTTAPTVSQQLAAAWEAKNIPEINRILAANSLTELSTKSQLKLTDAEIDYAKTLGVRFPDASAPIKPTIPGVDSKKIEFDKESQYLPKGTGELGAARQAGVTTAGAAATVGEIEAKAAEKVTAKTVEAEVRKQLLELEAAKGTGLSPESIIKPVTTEVKTGITGLKAAQGEATQITEAAPTRTLQSGELIEKPAVDRKLVEETLAKNEAAQGIVTEEMTVAGQLSKLLSDFETRNPPVWAASSIRNVTSVLAERGLGASSLAGQALIQATLESAIPIATADAAIYREMGLANLSNRQQMAILTAQQRAAFLGQEFDQEFQRRVINAATISDIANMNFSAKQQLIIENARLTETMNLANLNNRQAIIMAEAAQIAAIELTNLNNRQQAAVLNAKAFLDLDMKNLDNEQQTRLFKTQSIINTILSDQAAENSARQFNAASINQVNQFYDSLTAEIRQFNAAQKNSMSQFNAAQANSVNMFNAQQQNIRDQFNAENRRIIDQSNVEWRRTIALADTAAANRANEINASNALNITTIEYNNLWQKYRDEMEYAWKTGENALDRENELARQILVKQGTIEAAKYTAKAEAYKALGALGVTVFDKAGGTDAVAGLLKAGAGAVANAVKSTTTADQFIEIPGSGGARNWSDGTNFITILPDNSITWNGTRFDDNLAYQ